VHLPDSGVVEGRASKLLALEARDCTGLYCRSNKSR